MTMFGRYTFILAVLMAGLLSCKKDKDNGEPGEEIVTDAHQFISDQFGRQLILHGLNTSSSAKGAPDRMPWIAEQDVEREATLLGFNYVRLLIFWDFIEPEKGTFSAQYLDEVEKRVNWYTSRGMHVMLDMHQDIYSLKFGGDGAPEWAVRPDGASTDIDIDGPWWLANISPAVINSWKNFWEYTNHQDLQDHYILSWKFVAERFKNNPYVIGYDLMNEPWAGDLVKAFITGDFERSQLSAFYKRLIPALREVEPNKYLFFEPAPAPVTFGLPSHLPKVSDTRAGSKLVYAPHCYPASLHEGGPYKASDKKNLKDWERERRKDQAKHGDIPVVCGEFGVSPGSEGFEEFFMDIHDMFDRNLWHWAYWSNDDGGWSPLHRDGTETPILKHLVRAYPKATAGRIRSFSYDMATGVFNMTYTSNTSIQQPTEIFVPKRHFPNGYDLRVEGTSAYTEEFDEVKQLLYLKVNEPATVTVTIMAL